MDNFLSLFSKFLTTNRPYNFIHGKYKWYWSGVCSNAVIKKIQKILRFSDFLNLENFLYQEVLIS